MFKNKKNLWRINTPAKQRGYILVITLVLLSALLMMSLGFLKRTAESLDMAGYNRNAAESLVLAESAMNMLYGGLTYDGNLDNDDKVDNTEALDLNKMTELPLPYLYYVSTADQIEEAFPSILQKIANGEATGKTGDINNHIVKSSTETLKLSDLFGANARPIVFEFDANQHLTVSNKSWSELENSSKPYAISWIELVSNENISGKVQAYVQSVGKTGSSKSYVQRLVGYFPVTLGTRLGGLNESSL